MSLFVCVDHASGNGGNTGIHDSLAKRVAALEDRQALKLTVSWQVVLVSLLPFFYILGALLYVTLTAH